MLVIGKNPVLEILETSPKDVNKIILLKTLKPEEKLKKIVSIAANNGVDPIYLNKFDFAKYFNRKNKTEGITQGVVAFTKDYEYVGLKEIIEKNKKLTNPLIILLDEITDPHNMGAIIRSAVCLGADGIVIPRHNSAEINHTVFKASSGAVNHIAITKETNLSNSIKYLKENGYWVVGADLKADKLLFQTDLKMPVALVIGSEGRGMRPVIRDNCDILVRIPMTGSLNSLNASVSAGVIMYEIFRQKNAG